MINYKIVSSTNQLLPVGTIMPIEMDDIQIGDEVKFFTDTCICTQNVGAIVLNRKKDESNDEDFGAVYSLVPEIEEELVHPLAGLNLPELEEND